MGTNVGGGEEETGNNNSNYYTVPAPVNCVGDERFKREVQTLFAKLIAAIGRFGFGFGGVGFVWVYTSQFFSHSSYLSCDHLPLRRAYAKL